MNIAKIYLSEEGESGKLDYALLHTDVIVRFDTGTTYSAKFIAIQKLIDEIRNHRKSTKDPSNKYYWSKSMVIVNDMEKKDLFPMIEYMIEEGDFQIIFEKLS